MQPCTWDTGKKEEKKKKQKKKKKKKGRTREAGQSTSYMLHELLHEHPATTRGYEKGEIERIKIKDCQTPDVTVFGDRALTDWLSTVFCPMVSA